MSGNVPRKTTYIEIPIDAENGPALAYGMLLQDLDGLRYLDESVPIVGSFRLESTPRGNEVPEEIRQQWVGVDIPVRYTGTLEFGLVEITSEDAVLSLLAAGKLEAARWFAEQFVPMYPAWFFRAEEGSLTDGRQIGQDPMTSAEFYGQIVGAEDKTEYGFPE